MTHDEPKQATSVHFELHDKHKSAYQKYKSLTVGDKGFFFLLKYDILTALF